MDTSRKLGVLIVRWITVVGVDEFRFYSPLLAASHDTCVNVTRPLLNNVDREEELVDADIGLVLDFVSDPGLRALRVERDRLRRLARQLTRMARAGGRGRLVAT